MKTLLLAMIFAFSPAAFAQDGAPADATETPADADAPKDAEAPEDAPADEADADKAPADEADAKEEEPKKKVDLPAVEVPASEEEAIEDVQEAVNALQTGQWVTFGALLLGLLGFLWNRFGAKKDDATDTKAE